MIIEGNVAPGFEPIRALYEARMNSLAERNTQLCIYVGDTCVVDLWASAIDDPDFSGDSLVNVFSSGKSLEAITLAMLLDRGLLDFDAKISDYWPEFAANDKHETTVADLMRHEAGISAFDTTLDAESLHPNRIRENAIGEVIERHTQKFREGEGNQREYHAITRGWIANEVFRRVDPEGRTMGQFLREEVSKPLGADVHIGLHEHELERINPVAMLGFGYQFRQGFVPRAMGRKIELNIAQIIAKAWRMRAGLKGRTRLRAPVPIEGMQNLTVIDSPAVAMGEIPSAGAKCSARGLAKLAATMAGGGRLADTEILSRDAHDALHDKPVTRNMMALNTTFTQAGLARFDTAAADGPLDAGLNRGREGFYGWMGLGGSIFQWHPERRIGFAYVPTSLNVLDIVNERGKVYQAAVVECLDALAR